MKRFFLFFRYFWIAWALSGGSILPAQVATLRLAFHVFQTDSGAGNFHADSVSEMIFLKDLERWINAKAGNLDTLTPPVSSPYIPDAGFRIRVDTVFFHRDSHAWDCSVDIDAPYMRTRYVDQDSSLSYWQKYQTLPVFIGGNISVVGGHSRNIGDKGYIGMRGFYEQYLQNEYAVAVEESAKNLLHEIGHTVGLMHNFRGGSGGDQCDTCEDNGCPDIGTSNNIMDYWPSYGHALSECQTAIIRSHLNGERGNISDVVVNDSCWSRLGYQDITRVGYMDTLRITDTVYLHSSLEVFGVLEVTGYLSVPGACAISIRPRGRIVINGGTIGNLCGDLWYGISVDDNGTSESEQLTIINGGTLENAKVALKYEGAAQLTGGTATFRNNQVGIYLPQDDRPVTLKNIEFRTTRKLNRHEEGWAPQAFIQSQRSLFVSGCSFANEPGSQLFHPDSSGLGINIESFFLNVEYSRFFNLTDAIRARANQTLIGNNEFENNRCAVNLKSDGFTQVFGNSFELQRLNDVPTFGIVLHQPNLFKLEQNQFSSVYGGGQMAGIFLIGPDLSNSPTGDSRFANLPAAAVIMNPPDAEAELLKWANEIGNDLSRLLVGPQFRNNTYDKTPVQLIMMHDSVHGTMLGEPPGTTMIRADRITDWPVGGYQWYSESNPLTALKAEEASPDTLPAQHGLLMTMNQLDTGTGRFLSQDIDSLKSALRMLQYVSDHPGEFIGPDFYKTLQALSEIPMAARSAKIMRLTDPYNTEEQARTRQALARMAGTCTRVDSLLIDLRDTLALLMTRQGSCPERPTLPSTFPDLPDWPRGAAQHFLPSGDFSRVVPAFEVWPNPASDYIFLAPEKGYVPDETWRYEIFSAEGQLMQSGSFPGWQSLKIETRGLSGGIYFIRIFGSRRNLGIQRFIIIPA